MLQQHPYLNQPENVQLAVKYNKPINLSQQLSFQQTQPQTQPDQNYATPQWQKPMNQIYTVQQTQPQIQQIQSKYIPQTQQSHVQPIQQQVLIVPQQVRQQPQQQYVEIVPQQQQPLRQSSPPRVYKMPKQHTPPPQYSPPPQVPFYQEYQPQYAQPPPFERPPAYYYEEPILQPPPVQRLQPDVYFKPTQASYIKDLDERGSRYQEFPFRKETIEDYFIKALIDMATQEEKIEKAKIDLFIQPDFRVVNLFSFFTRNNGDILEQNDLIAGLRAFSLQPESCDIKLLFEEYGDQGVMNIQQFGDMINPQKVLKNTKAYENDDEKLLPETKIKIRKLFVVLLNAESVFEGHRQELVMKELEFGEPLEYKQLHGQIFYNEHVEDLKYYLRSHGQYFDLDTIKGLFKRFDRNCSGKITINEFVYGFQAKIKDSDLQL